MIVRGKTPGRNKPCICGSGKKYKNCCQGGIHALESIPVSKRQDVLVEMVFQPRRKKAAATSA